MTVAYWKQFDHSEIMSMHGVEIDDETDREENEEIEIDENSDCCPDCLGSGCNDCLMLSW